MTASELKDAVLARYRSVYAFCRAHPEIKRATVYLVLSGRYPGKWNEQAAKIQAALSEAGESPRAQKVTPDVVGKALQEIRCSHCRRLDRRECLSCREQTERESEKLFFRLFQGG